MTMPNSSIQNENMYEDLREDGASKEKAARISNAAAALGKPAVGRTGGESGSYAEWNVSAAQRRPKEQGLTSYAGLTKADQGTKRNGRAAGRGNRGQGT